MKPPTKNESDALMRQWAKKEGVTRSSSNDWGKLVKKPYKKPSYEERMFIEKGDDHCTLWNKDGKPYCYISQPYGLTYIDIKAMYDRAEKYGLKFDISSWPAWHYPTAVVFVKWTAK